MELKRDDFSEETIYVCECPSCNEMIETSEDPSYEHSVYCDSCGDSFDLID